MRTYEEFAREAAWKSDNEKAIWCRNAIESFKATPEYKAAADGEAYYNKHNITMEKYQRFLYTMTGKQVPDLISANYKLKSTIFRRLVTQQVQYVLGNGVTFENEETKERLGDRFDFTLQKAAKRAMAEGQAFGFWNIDHLEVFAYADTKYDAGFMPLYHSETGELMAGVRFWIRTVNNKKIIRMTVYEADGYTDYSVTGDEVTIINPKRGYIATEKKTEAGGVEDIVYDNYGVLPIIPLFVNDSGESELIGIRENIDCYDFIKSGLANEIDDTSGIYWIIKNAGGMDDVDMAGFLQRLKTVHASNVSGDDTEVQAHTVDIPVQARQTMLEILRADIYEDFQALDVKTLSAAAKTTQEIQAAYQSQDNKCADFEYYIIDFIQRILAIVGIDDNPTFTWNRVVNQAEQTNMVLAAANYLTDDVIIKHLPFLTPEEALNVISERDGEDMNRFGGEETGDEE